MGDCNTLKSFSNPRHCDPHLDQTKLNDLLPLTIDDVLVDCVLNSPEFVLIFVFYTSTVYTALVSCPTRLSSREQRIIAFDVLTLHCLCFGTRILDSSKCTVSKCAAAEATKPKMKPYKAKVISSPSSKRSICNIRLHSSHLAPGPCVNVRILEQ